MVALFVCNSKFITNYVFKHERLSVSILHVWSLQHAAWGSQLGQRPTSVTHCQDTTEDTRRRVRQPLLGGMPCGLTYIETQSQVMIFLKDNI